MYDEYDTYETTMGVRTEMIIYYLTIPYLIMRQYLYDIHRVNCMTLSMS